MNLVRVLVTPGFLALTTCFAMGVFARGEVVLVFPFVDRLVQEPRSQGLVTLAILVVAVGLSLAGAGLELLTRGLARPDREPALPDGA